MINIDCETQQRVKDEPEPIIKLIQLIVEIAIFSDLHKKGNSNNSAYSNHTQISMYKSINILDGDILIDNIKLWKSLILAIYTNMFLV